MGDKCRTFPQIHLINLDRSVGPLRRFKERNPHIHDLMRASGVYDGKVDCEELIRSR
jgi:hypothetical protein